MTIDFYLPNLVTLLASIGAAAIAIKESRGRTIPRWRVLAPGVLATLAIVIQIAFPQPWDLLNLARWTLVFLAFLAGGVRGRLMAMSSDRALALVRVHRSPEVRWVAVAQALFALLLFGLQVTTLGESEFAPTIEFVMMTTAGYLLGRGAIAWLRAGRLVHEDLRD
jgi:hypothetical protein